MTKIYSTIISFLLFGNVASYGALVVYTNEADFLGDIANAGLTAVTLNFDAQAVADLPNPATVEHITFQNASTPLRIDDSFEAPSGSNYLGVPNAGTFNQFQLGDSFDMSFPPSNAIGFNIVTAETAGVSWFSNNIRIDVPGIGGVGVDQTELNRTLPNFGDSVYFIGLIDTMNTFTTAEVTSPGGGLAFYNIDDITTSAVPEPGAIWLLLIVSPLFGCFCYWRRTYQEQ